MADYPYPTAANNQTFEDRNRDEGGVRDENFVTPESRDIGDARTYGCVKAARIISPTRDAKQWRVYKRSL